MSVKSHQKRAPPLWLPLPLVHYPNRGECTPIQVSIHRGKLGIWGNGGNLRKRRGFEKTKRTKEKEKKILHSLLFLSSLFTIPSQLHLLLLYFLDLLLFSFHFLILQFLFLHSTAVPILSGIELHWNVLWCSWGFSHRWHSAKIEHRPILSPCLDSHHMYHRHHHHHYHHYHHHHSITIGFIIKITVIIAINTI